MMLFSRTRLMMKFKPYAALRCQLFNAQRASVQLMIINTSHHQRVARDAYDLKWFPSLVVSNKRLLTNSSRVLLLNDNKKEKEVDTIEKRQMKIENERLNQEIKSAQVSQSSQLVMDSLPNSLRPYIELMRLNKPKPILLVYWPSAWAILGAASYLHLPLPDFYLLGLFLAGATFSRAAGCIVNDMWDRKLDAQVERTQNRPLASGRIGMPTAFALLAGNLSLCLACLLQLNLPTQIIGACALFPISLYPTAKRFTNWPQLILGTTFGWGSIMGWSAVVFSSTTLAADINIFAFTPALFLYAASISWITMYDTIYGYQDIKYDREMGIRSASIHLEKRLKLSLLAMSSFSLANLGVFGWLTHQEPIYYICLGAAGLHFLKQIVFFDPKSPRSALKHFNSNNTVGAIVAFGLLASLLIK